MSLSGQDGIGAVALLGLLHENAADLVTLCSADGVLRFVSPTATSMLGWNPGELIGRGTESLVHPDEAAVSVLARTAALASTETVVTTQRFLCADGGYLWTESATRQIPDPGRPGHLMLLASVRNVADRKLVEARLERLALTDPLTGIANRTVLLDRLTQALRRLERHQSILAVIYLDLDRFKVINDSLGHKVGDRLLMMVAERAVRSLRPTDTLARVGGDEFVVVAEDMTDPAQAVALAERVCAGMMAPFDLGGESVVCTVSAGVATTTDYNHSPQGMLQEADLALYRAKNRGRNRAEVFDEELRSTAVGRMGIEQMLRHAILHRELRAQYQPIIDLRTGHVASVEALVRVQGPGGLIMPDSFIGVAEESGLLVAIDEWVLTQAVAQAADWQRQLKAADFRGVAVNITGRHLADSHLSEVMSDALAVNKLASGSLSVEVTERVLMEASNSSMSGLRNIRAMGVSVGLDDFGTGYSSLAYLRQFPLDFVKIDQSFVSQLASTEEVAIVTAIIDLAHALKLSVVAEGIETVDQLRILRRLQCDQGQGFLFSHADDAEAITSLIEEGVSVTM